MPALAHVEKGVQMFFPQLPPIVPEVSPLPSVTSWFLNYANEHRASNTINNEIQDMEFI